MLCRHKFATDMWRLTADCATSLEQPFKHAFDKMPPIST